MRINSWKNRLKSRGFSAQNGDHSAPVGRNRLILLFKKPMESLANMLAFWMVQAGLGFGAVVLAELVRDLYHVAGHYWEPLQKSHSLHHKAYRRDLSPVSLELYCKAQLHNDVPEGSVMAVLLAAIAFWGHNALGLPGFALWTGVLYSLMFVAGGWARSQGWLLSTDLTHKPGDLVEVPTPWFVNRTYHWRHHFDSGNAYYCGYFTIIDKILGTSLALKGKTVAITGASGTLGRSLIAVLQQRGAKVVALTTSATAEFDPAVRVQTWTAGAEEALAGLLADVDILIINHGINVGSDRSAAAIAQSYEVNALSAWRLLETFLQTVTRSEHRALKEVWVNTSEAEALPAFSPLYELSKRAIGDLVTLRRLDAPCIVRKLVLGPFRSNLNPVGVMSADWVARLVVALAQRDVRNIIVTIDPLTYVVFPLKEWAKSLYYRLFSRSPRPQP